MTICHPYGTLNVHPIMKGEFMGIIKKPIPVLTDKQITSYWEKVLKTTDCWVWQPKNPRFCLKRHGHFNPKRISMHLAGRSGSCSVVKTSDGDLLLYHDIRRHCENKNCVNPDHLSYIPYTCTKINKITESSLWPYLMPEIKGMIKDLRKEFSVERIVLGLQVNPEIIRKLCDET